MANFAVLIDGVVDNIIVADSLEIAQDVIQIGLVVEYFEDNQATIGFEYDGEKFEQRNPTIAIKDDVIEDDLSVSS